MANETISPELRVMLVEWRAASIRQANSIGQLLGLEVVRTEREHVRRLAVRPSPPPPPKDGQKDG